MRLRLCGPARPGTPDSVLYDVDFAGPAAETVPIYPSGTGTWPVDPDSVASVNGPDGEPGVVESGSAFSAGATSPALPATPGVTYHITGNARTDCDAGDPLLHVRFYDAADVQLAGEVLVAGVAPGDEAWHSGSGDFTAPANTAYMKVLPGAAALCRVWYDDVTITAAGSPGEDLLNGTSPRASRCDHQHHWFSIAEPTADDDTTLGFRVGTIWHQVDDDPATEILAEWVLADASAGAAVWLAWPAATDGDDGVGVPAGGTTGQVLKKASDTDFDTEWSDETGDSGGGDLANPMTDGGDIIYGKPGTTINHALTSGGASASSNSGNWSGNPSNVIDGNDSSQWSSSSFPVSAIMFIVDLGSVETISRIRFKQGGSGNGFTGNYASAIDIQTSPDGSTWSTIQSESGFPSTGGEHTFDLDTPTAARYWRLDATAGGGNGWTLFTVELLEVPTDLGSPQRLPIGTEGQILTVVSGVPAWVDP